MRKVLSIGALTLVALLAQVAPRPGSATHAVRCPMTRDEALDFACTDSTDAAKKATITSVGLSFRPDLDFISSVTRKCGKRSPDLVNAFLNSRAHASCAEPSFLRAQATPSIIDAGASTTLSWAASYANTVRITPDGGVQDSEGELKLAPDRTTTYTLSADGPGGTATTQVKVTVTPLQPPVILSFQAPGSVERGKPATLHWSVNNAISVQIDPGLGTVPLTGDRVVSPAQTTVYTLTATNGGGSVTSRATINVTTAPPVITFTVTPALVRRPETATLRWNVTGADQIVSWDGKVVDSSGSAVISPYQSTAYRLRATGQGGTVARDVTVNVSNPGPPRGSMVWSGSVRSGMQNHVTILGGTSDVGQLRGTPLPGVPCVVSVSQVNANTGAVKTKLKSKANAAGTIDLTAQVVTQPSEDDAYQRVVLLIESRKNTKTNLLIQWAVSN